MPITLLHKIVSNPFIYDLSQRLAGSGRATKIFKEEFLALPKTGKVLDVGGGTGLMRPLFAPQWEYCCLDSDPQKLAGFQSKFPKDNFLQASACEIPKPDKSYDLCIMFGVTHHLTDHDMVIAFKEIRRVLKDGGTFILMDSVWNPRNLAGRFMYFVDRGSHPKTKEKIKTELSNRFHIARTKEWRIQHEYLLCWSIKSASGA